MRRIWNWLPSFGSSLLLAANALAAPSAGPLAATDDASPSATAPTPATEQLADEREMRPLLERLGQLSQLIDRDGQSPQAWQHHLEQAEVLLRLAGYSRDKERETTLRMAVDGFFSAALLAPKDQPSAVERLRQLPQRLAQAFPGNPAIHHAVLREIEADSMRVLERSGDNVKAQQHRCTRLLQFAQQHPDMPEAAKIVLEAARVCESIGETNMAGRCYRYLMEHFAGDVAARKAEGALWRLDPGHAPVQLQLPLLYPTGHASEDVFNVDQCRGKLVIVYFWTSTSQQTSADFETLKHLTDHHGGRGLAVVYVNMDDDPAQGRAFLSGRLMAGVHLHQAGGLQGAVAERYGIQEVPHAFLLGRDGGLLKHSLPVSRLEEELDDRLQDRH
jgi:hypothetical protein